MPWFPHPVTVSGVSVRSAAGSDVEAHVNQWKSGKSALIPCREPLGMPHLLAGYLQDRTVLKGRRYGATSNFAVRLARDAVVSAAWKPEDLKDAWLFVGSSRGNAGELLNHWPERRAVKKFSASNSMHSELGAAISIELGIQGPWQVLSNGCASGLDAVGWAAWAVSTGMAPRAIAVGVDLPLVTELLQDFRETGLLSLNGVNDPYAPSTGGFFPAEAGAALCLEKKNEDFLDDDRNRARAWSQIWGYYANSDAYDSLCLPPGGGGTLELLKQIQTDLAEALPQNVHWAICPHASGTLAHGTAEQEALRLWEPVGERRSLHGMKPFIGHSLGASGAVDVAVLSSFLAEGYLPPNMPHQTHALGGHWEMPDVETEASGTNVIKLAASMGGHNAALIMSAPE